MFILLSIDVKIIFTCINIAYLYIFIYECFIYYSNDYWTCAVKQYLVYNWVNNDVINL